MVRAEDVWIFLRLGLLRRLFVLCSSAMHGGVTRPRTMMLMILYPVLSLRTIGHVTRHDSMDAVYSANERSARPRVEPFLRFIRAISSREPFKRRHGSRNQHIVNAETMTQRTSLLRSRRCDVYRLGTVRDARPTAPPALMRRRWPIGKDATKWRRCTPRMW